MTYIWVNIVQVMVCCLTAPSHFLNQCWSYSLITYYCLHHYFSLYHIWIYILCWFLSKDIWHQPLQWRHNGQDGVSNHQPHHCLLNRLFKRRSKKTSKLRATGLCAGNSPGTGEFPAQRASNAENVSIWWCHHDPCDNGGKLYRWRYSEVSLKSYYCSRNKLA